MQIIDCFLDLQNPLWGYIISFFIITYPYFDIWTICLYNSINWLCNHYKLISKSQKEFDPLYVCESYVGCANVSFMGFDGHEHRCLWYYVFTYHIGRAWCKECLVLDECTHLTIQRYTVVERTKYICLKRNIFQILLNVCKRPTEKKLLIGSDNGLAHPILQN